MGAIEARLKELGYELPPPFVFPKQNRTGCTQAVSLLLLSGHGLDLPKLPGVRQTASSVSISPWRRATPPRARWPSP